jgi:hypothetical protein
MNKWIAGALLVALASPAIAHTGGSVNADTSVSTNGIKEMWIRNEYEKPATFTIEVTYKDGTDVPPELWRSDAANDKITIDLGQPAWFTIQTKIKGKYYVCTKLESDHGVSSRICSRHWHK